jgi:hypothetical protein
MNPIRNFPLYISKIDSKIVLPSMHRSSKWTLPFRFPNKIFLYSFHLSHAYYMSSPSHSPWCDHSYNMWWSAYETSRYTLFSSLPPFPPSKVQIFFSAPCFQTPSIYVLPLIYKFRLTLELGTRVYPKVSELAAWSENRKW